MTNHSPNKDAHHPANRHTTNGQGGGSSLVILPRFGRGKRVYGFRFFFQKKTNLFVCPVRWTGRGNSIIGQ